MKKILITGANSYIGTSFEKYMAQFGDKYQIDTVDMIDGTWREKDFSGYDSVFHVAGIAHSDNGKISKEKEKLYYAVNTDLTVETAKKAKADGVKQFIFMSSAIVYGNSAPIGKGKRITKDTPVRPANCYGDSKVQAENGLRPLNDDNFKVVILRPPMIYGNGSKGNYPLMSKMAQKLPIFPYVKNRRSMLYIENLCEFVRLMIKNNEQGIFWPQNREYSNTSEMVKMIGEAHGKKVRLIRGFEWALKLLGLFTGLVDKAFGNLYYDKALSVYKQNYRVADLKWSVFLTEDTSDTRSVNKKKALMLASVASMIDQFNIPNIEILQSLGYEVDVVANFEEPGTITIERANDLKKKLAGMNANVTHVAIPRTLNPKAIFTAYRSVKRIINKGNYDLIHCHSPIGGAICRLAAIKARRKGTKVIYTAHGFHFYDGAPKKNWIVYYPVERVLSWVTDVLITINNEDFNRSKKEFHVKNVVKVPGVGVNTQKFRECDVNTREKRKLLGIPNDSFVLLSVGELQDRKNHRIVIEALHKINNSNIVYLVVGKGELENEYKKIIKDYHLEKNIMLLGFRSDIDELCKISDCFVHPSIREGLGIAPLEGMAAGLPLISAYINGIKDYTKDGISGCCIDPCSVTDTVNAIEKMYGDSSFRNQCGKNNIDKAKEYDQNRTNEVMLNLYRNV